MPLTGSATCRTPGVIDQIAEELGCEAAVIDAIVTVEANGSGFDKAGRLVIRPEAHKIKVCPLLTPAEKAKAVKLGFTKQPKTASYASNNLLAGDQCWTYVDNFRKAFGDDAAFWITSFGAPQIMGFNHRHCGYELPSQMVSAFAESEDAQLIGMCRYLKSTGLGPALKTRNWKAIARGYNGTGYAQNRYDVKLREAYERSSCKKGSVVHDLDDVLQFGDSGNAVTLLQNRLRELGFYVDNDGDFGDETLDAVRAFQRRNALTVDGKVGIQTRKVMDMAAPKEPNKKPVTKIVAESKTAQAGLGTSLLGLLGLGTATGSMTTAEIGYVPPVPSVSLETVNDTLVQAERGVGAAHKIFSLGTEKILLALCVCAIAFGLITFYRRVIAQRLRKVG